MRLAVLGDPVAHSLSPVLHTAALAAAGIPGDYEARRVDAAGMAAALDDLRNGRLDGANVTMPHKHLAAQLADDLAETARRAGAVNTFVRVAGSVVGHNTDVAGVVHAWTWGGLPEDVPVLILGAGGAAAAAAIALEGRPMTVATRRPSTAQSLIDVVGIDADVVELGTPIEGAVVVNATPLGMHGEDLPSAVLDAAGGLLDMAYGRKETPAVTWCRTAGMPCADGQSMLLGQAVAAFRLWTGKSPLDAMRTALEAVRASTGKVPA